ncbi:unnamed protein product, partial [Iphiclides podalirius]
MMEGPNRGGFRGGGRGGPPGLRGRGGFDMRGRGGPGMRGRGGPPRGGPGPRGGPRGFRGMPMRGGGGDRGGRFPPGPQGPGPHPVPTIETRGGPPQRGAFNNRGGPGGMRGRGGRGRGDFGLRNDRGGGGRGMPMRGRGGRVGPGAPLNGPPEGDHLYLINQLDCNQVLKVLHISVVVDLHTEEEDHQREEGLMVHVVEEVPGLQCKVDIKHHLSIILSRLMVMVHLRIQVTNHMNNHLLNHFHHHHTIHQVHIKVAAIQRQLQHNQLLIQVVMDQTMATLRVDKEVMRIMDIVAILEQIWGVQVMLVMELQSPHMAAPLLHMTHMHNLPTLPTSNPSHNIPTAMAVEASCNKCEETEMHRY